MHTTCKTFYIEATGTGSRLRVVLKFIELDRYSFHHTDQSEDAI